MEKVIDRRIREVHNFHRFQCGFLQSRSCDTAILRLVRAIAQGCKYVCILDLRQAYASVPRGDLIQRIAQLVPRELTAMVESLLSDTFVSTIGDDTNRWLEVDRGVPEGSPMSPVLFNLYIDPLAKVIEETAVEWEQALNLFADDVVLMAPSAEKMQRLLLKCGEWADENGLTWGVAKCHALAAPSVPRPPLTLAGEVLQYSDTADYLGVRVSATGVTEGGTIERLRSAECRIRQLKAAGMLRPRLSVNRLRCIYLALFRPVWTYSLHITPFSNVVREHAAALVDATIQWLYPKLARHSRRRFQP